MRILFFSPYFYPYISGLTIYPKRVLEYLSKKHKVAVLTFNHEANSLKIENGKLKIVRLPYWFKISKGYIAPLSLLDFWQHVWQNDLIILNQPNFEGLILAIFGRIFKKKIISIVHCQVFLPRSFINGIINFFLNLSFYLQLWLSNIILPTTQDYADSLLFGQLFKTKIKPIFPSISLTPVSLHYINIIKSQKGEAVWIGYVGRIAVEKGIEYLVQSIKRLNLINKKIKLVFAGPNPEKVAGEKHYWDKIKNQLKHQKTDYLFFEDLSDEELSAFYKTIDILVLPSINQTEAFGMVQVEAMLRGTPVIAANLPGIRVPLKLTKMGLLVDPKNSQQLTDAILKILKNKNKYTNNQVIENAKKIFNPNKVFKFYDDLVDSANLRMTS